MLNIYLIREDIDKNKVIFEQIRNTAGNKVLIVPDQYTLQSEKNVFKYLNKTSVIDLEVLSPSRLGYKILKETGKPQKVLLDKYGRQMLLFSITQKNASKLKHFTKILGTSAFIELLDKQISEFQQYYIDSSSLNFALSQIDQSCVLHHKLSDLALLYSDYEAEIAKKYIDTKDINEIFIDHVKFSDFVLNTSFWISEYDYMAPKNLEFLIQIIAKSKNVNIFLTEDINPNSPDSELFDITKKFIHKLQASCKKINVSCALTQVDDDYYKIAKSDALRAIERQIFSYPLTVFPLKANEIHLRSSKNIYTEAETAAVYIRNLLANSEYKLKDIAVICNDIENYGSIIKRTFEEYGIKCFLDKNRDVRGNALVALNLTLLQIARNKLSTNAIISFLKSGFSSLSHDEIEKLENYSKKYKIRGNMWLKDFYKIDSTAKFEPTLDEINALRHKVISPLSKFRTEMNSCTSTTEKIKALYNFIKIDLAIPEKLKIKIKEYEALGLTEAALENSQIWNIIVNLYEQLALILKDELLSNESIEEILKSGFASIELGMIPSTSDEVLIGNMQRSRIGQVPIMLILAANEGILPLTNSTDHLINDDEKLQLLSTCDLELGELNQTKLLEENLAIYRMLCTPLHEIFISYEKSTLSGDSMKPSQIFLRLAEIFEQNDIKGDIYKTPENLDLLSIPSLTMLHLASKLRKDADLSESELLALLWCKENSPDIYNKLVKALKFEIKVAKLPKTDVKQLYLGNSSNLRLSPSKLEKYSACPFSYFLQYGIKPLDNRLFELSGRQLGDIYHFVAQKVAENLNTDNLPLSNVNSNWQTITDEEIKSLIDDIISQETLNYQNGLLFDEAESPYKISRIKKVCYQAIRAIIEQIRAGKIEKMLCEVEFRNSKVAHFPAIKIDGDIPISIEGKIDRVDIINANDTRYCKIVDYKSGFKKFDKDSVIAGFELQLALYLSAVTNGLKNTKPAGMFYFHFSDKNLSVVDEHPDEISNSDLLKEYKLDGIFLDSKDVINSLDADFTRFSKIANIQKTKDGFKKNEKYMLNESEFESFLSSVNSVISKVCNNLNAGDIRIHPAKTSIGNACEFCDFKSICKFDKTLPNCNYNKTW